MLAEGVHAAIEVKPDISTLTENSEFHRALKQMASVKKLKRQIQFMPTGYIPPDHSIPSIIFSNKSRSLNDMTNYMIQQVDKGILKSTDLPDIILTMDHGIIYHTPFASQCMFKDFVSSQTPIVRQNLFLEIPGDDSTLAFFIFLLYSLTPPEPFLAEPILKKYLSSINTAPITVRQY